MALRNPATVAVLLLALVFISDPNFSSAATGGHSGGSVFPSGRGSSSSSSSWSSRSSRSSGSSGSRLWDHSGGSVFPSGGGSSSSSSSGSSGSSGFKSWDHSRGDHNLSDGGYYGLLIFVAVSIGAMIFYHCVAYGKVSVVKLQVGLVGKARSLQKDLNLLTVTTNMSTAKGLSHLLTGTSTSLLRNLDYCISSYSSVTLKSKMEDAEQCFKRLSMEEVAKFDKVTLANVNNFMVKSISQSPNEGHKEYVVVTILVSTRGTQKLPIINGSGDLKKALKSLGSIPSDKILAVEVLWTPQQENDTLTEKELLKGYPQLRGFYDPPGSLEEESFDESHPFIGVTVVKN